MIHISGLQTHAFPTPKSHRRSLFFPSRNSFGGHHPKKKFDPPSLSLTSSPPDTRPHGAAQRGAVPQEPDPQRPPHRPRGRSVRGAPAPEAGAGGGGQILLVTSVCSRSTPCGLARGAMSALVCIMCGDKEFPITTRPHGTPLGEHDPHEVTYVVTYAAQDTRASGTVGHVDPQDAPPPLTLKCHLGDAAVLLSVARVIVRRPGGHSIDGNNRLRTRRWDGTTARLYFWGYCDALARRSLPAGPEGPPQTKRFQMSLRI